MDNKVGYGVNIQGEIETQVKGGLRHEATVFQAEVQAILTASKTLLTEKVNEKIINIFVGSN